MTNGAPPASPPPLPPPGVTDPPGILTGRFPDISPAQIVAVVGAVITVAIAFGANISKEQQIAILSLAGAVAAILLAADAHVRTRRNHAEALKHVADRHLQATHTSVTNGQPPPSLTITH
jgi:hypothetical protein